MASSQFGTGACWSAGCARERAENPNGKRHGLPQRLTAIGVTYHVAASDISPMVVLIKCACIPLEEALLRVARHGS